MHKCIYNQADLPPPAQTHTDTHTDTQTHDYTALDNSTCYTESPSESLSAQHPSSCTPSDDACARIPPTINANAPASAAACFRTSAAASVPLQMLLIAQHPYRCISSDNACARMPPTIDATAPALLPPNLANSVQRGALLCAYYSIFLPLVYSITMYSMTLGHPLLWFVHACRSSLARAHTSQEQRSGPMRARVPEMRLDDGRCGAPLLL